MAKDQDVKKDVKIKAKKPQAGPGGDWFARRGAKPPAEK